MNENNLVIPPYFDLSSIEGSTLNNILETDNWLDELRRLYTADNVLFYDIRDELILRGFKFSATIESNLFPNKEIENSSYIYVTNDKKVFLKLQENDILGFSYLLKRYKVRSDKFLNGIVLENLSELLKKNPSLVKQRLMDAGFAIVNVNNESIDSIAVSYIKETEDAQSYLNDGLRKTENNSTYFIDIPLETENTKDYPTKFLKETESKNIYLIENPEENDNYQYYHDNVPLSQLFEPNKYQNFLELCDRENICVFSEITIEIIEEYRKQPGVGEIKYLRLKQLLKELDYNFLPKKQNIQQLDFLTIPDKLSYFCNNYFRKILEANDISYLDFMNDIYAEDNYDRLSEKIDIFRGKIDYLEKNANLIFSKRKNIATRETILNLTVYQELKLFKWITLKELLKIDLNSKEKIDDDIHLYEIIENDEYIFMYSLLYNRMIAYEPIKETIEGIISELPERRLTVLKMRTEGRTLEEIGSTLQLTRERIRQIEQKTWLKVERILNFKNIEAYIRKSIAEEYLLTYDKLVHKLVKDEKSKIILNYYLMKNTSFEIKSDILFDIKEHRYIKEVVTSLYRSEERILFVNEIFTKLNEDIKFEITLEKLDIVMSELYFRRVKDIYIYTKASLNQFISHIFKYKVKGPLEMTEENFEYLNQLMRDTFDKEFENGRRAATARITDTKNIVLVDSNTYMYTELDTLSLDLISIIGEKIEVMLEEYTTITAYSMFTKYETLWRKYDIDNAIYLYSIIQYSYNDDYQIGRGNTLSITRLHAPVENATDILIQVLNRNGNVMSKADILATTHWQNYKLEQLINPSPYFMSVELDNHKYGVRLFESYGFTDEELENILTFVSNYMTKDYIYTKDLMIEMEFDDDMSALLANKQIYKLYDFGSLIKKLLPNLRGFHQFIYVEKSAIKTIEEAIAQTYEEIVSRQELTRFLGDKGYSEVIITPVLQDLVNKKYFYPYTTTTYINCQQVVITEEVIKGLKDYLDQQLLDIDYLSVYDLVNYKSLPEISTYSWEPCLIAHLVTVFSESLDYVIIDTTTDYRYNKLLVVHSSLAIQDVAQLAHKLLQEEYKGNYHVSDIAAFLKTKNLLYTPNLNNDIKMSNLFEINEYGYLKLNEV